MAGYSVISICNLALRRVGSRKTITDLGSNESEEAIHCNALYAHARDTVLDAFPWPFAMKYATLDLVEDLSEEEDDENRDWNYSYRYPTDCLKVRRIVTSAGRLETVPEPFEIGQDSAGLLIYTDEEDAKIQYTARFTNSAQFSPIFADALAWRLAADLAMPLSQEESVRETAERFYRYALGEAQATHRNESQRDRSMTSDFIDARE